MRKHFSLNLTIVVFFSLSIITLFCIEQKKEKSLSAAGFNNSSVIVIDAGHGGEDGGAVGVGELLEKDINLAISSRLELILNLCGKNTDMIRREDMSLGENISTSIKRRKTFDIKKRVDIINGSNNPIVISIHQNSFPQDKSCFGAQVFYSKNNVESKKLANATQESLRIGINGKNDRVEKPIGKNVYLMNNVICPAILVECGFITNKSEADMLCTESYQKRISSCIASGCLQYKEK